VLAGNSKCAPREIIAVDPRTAARAAALAIRKRTQCGLGISRTLRKAALNSPPNDRLGDCHRETSTGDSRTRLGAVTPKETALNQILTGEFAASRFPIIRLGSRREAPLSDHAVR
jgi:hypothetical protein